MAESTALIVHALIFALSSIALTDGVEKVLDSAIAWKLTPSISLAVVHDGRVAYVGARGSTIHTRYPIGELGTLFVAVAIVQLEAARRVRLDDSLTKYLPPQESLDIPLRALLPPQHDDNTNYEALAAVVERVTREPLLTYITDHIFRPAHMSETWMGEPPEWLALAMGYYQWADDFKEASVPKESWSSKCCAFVSTAGDLARFDAALFRGSLIPATSFHELLPAFTSSQNARMGMIGRIAGPNGYEAENVLAPADRFAIVSLTNCAGFASPAVLDRIFSVYYPQVAAPLIAADRQRDPNPQITAQLRATLGKRFGAQEIAGPIEALSSSTSAATTEYRYLVTIRGKTHSAFFMLNPDGTMGTLWLHPQTPERP